MKKILFTAMLLLLLVGVDSCKKEATYLKTDKTAVSMLKEGGSETIQVSTDGDWTVGDVKEDWLTVDKQDSSIVVKIEANKSGASRSAEIVVSSGEKEVKIPVNQIEKCTFIKPSVTSLKFGSSGGTETVGIETDGNKIQTEAPEFITAEYSNGQLKVTTTANSGDSRAGKVRVYCDDVNAEISFQQAGTVCSRCHGKGKIKCPTCGGYGYVEHWEAGIQEMGTIYCGACDGMGKKTCPKCHGSGKAN